MHKLQRIWSNHRFCELYMKEPHFIGLRVEMRPLIYKSRNPTLSAFGPHVSDYDVGFQYCLSVPKATAWASPKLHQKKNFQPWLRIRVGKGKRGHCSTFRGRKKKTSSSKESTRETMWFTAKEERVRPPRAFRLLEGFLWPVFLSSSR